MQPWPFLLLLPQLVSCQIQANSTLSEWGALLGNLLLFYEAQRSGPLPTTNRVPWRNSSCLDDGKDVGIDLSGGYYDAGDYIKATFPFCFTVMSICWSGLDFGRGYDRALQTPYLDGMLRWSLDWLMKAHPSDNTLYVQVGDANLDNAYWGGDLEVPVPRTSYQINDTSPGTDVAAQCSAAFSACSALYSHRGFNGSYSEPASLQNDSYAQTLLTHANKLYSFAVNATGGQKLYQDSVPVVSQSYPSSSYGDELVIAALFLAWSQNSTELLQEAINYYDQYQFEGQNSVFNWDSKAPAISVLFAQISQSGSGLGGNLSIWQAEAERYFDAIVHDQAGHLTPGGLLFYDGASDDATLNPPLNTAMLLTRFAPLSSNRDKKQAYTNYAQGQVDYVLGKNPMFVPYIVGINPNSPSNPHSALASGGNDIGKIDSLPEKEAYLLVGAVVGGPDKQDQFYDIRSDWPQTEVALDYNAPMLALAAAHVMDDQEKPFYVNLQPGSYQSVKPQGTPCDAAFPCSGPTLNQGGKIAMGVIFTVVGLTIVLLFCRYFWIIHAGVKTE